MPNFGDSDSPIVKQVHKDVSSVFSWFRKRGIPGSQLIAIFSLVLLIGGLTLGVFLQQQPQDIRQQAQTISDAPGCAMGNQLCDNTPCCAGFGLVCQGAQGSMECENPTLNADFQSCNSSGGVCGSTYIGFHCGSEFGSECNSEPQTFSSFDEAYNHTRGCGQVDQVWSGGGTKTNGTSCINSLCGSFTIVRNNCGNPPPDPTDPTPTVCNLPVPPVPTNLFPTGVIAPGLSWITWDLNVKPANTQSYFVAWDNLDSKDSSGNTWRSCENPLPGDVCYTNVEDPWLNGPIPDPENRTYVGLYQFTAGMNYSWSVTAINACGVASAPAVGTVSVPSVAACSEACTSNANCTGVNVQCLNIVNGTGMCRNIQCSNDTDCVCDGRPTTPPGTALNQISAVCNATNTGYIINANWTGGANGNFFLDIDNETPHAGTYFNLNNGASTSLSRAATDFIQYDSSNNSYNSSITLTLTPGTTYFGKVYDSQNAVSSNYTSFTVPSCAVPTTVPTTIPTTNPTTAPTTIPTTAPTTVIAPVCLNITMNNPEITTANTPPDISDVVTFRCAPVVGATRYEFSIKTPNGQTLPIDPSVITPNVSNFYQFLSAGTHVAQCRACATSESSSCSPWEM